MDGVGVVGVRPILRPGRWGWWRVGVGASRVVVWLESMDRLAETSEGLITWVINEVIVYTLFSVTGGHLYHSLSSRYNFLDRRLIHDSTVLLYPCSGQGEASWRPGQARVGRGEGGVGGGHVCRLLFRNGVITIDTL